MSNKSGISSQIISVPKGGGALQGIGEKFSPDLQTGTGNFSIPIAIPPGRSGFQPQLQLTYSTGSGNGPFGLGWSLSVPGVSRKTSKGIPRYSDQDTFILSGAEDLVTVPGGSATRQRYRPRTEGVFARIEHIRVADGDYWLVRGKDGLTSYYGTPGSLGRDPATLVDPENDQRIFGWKLSRTVDPFGNRIDYIYERDAVRQDGPHHWDQLYLSQIRYIDYGSVDKPSFLVTVRFQYEERPDPFSEYRAGFEIRTVRRCRFIHVQTHDTPNTTVRSYEFVYLDQGGGPAEGLPLNRVSLLGRMQVSAQDGLSTQRLPPLVLDYSRFEPNKREFGPLTGPDLPPASLGHPDYELVDLFGNGLPDILELNGAARYWRNLGGGRFDWPRPMSSAPAGLRLADRGVQIIDANGDGRADLMVSLQNQNGYYPLRFGGLWDHRSFHRYSSAPSFDLEDPEVRLVDLDGDGVTDAIRSGTSIELYFNDAQKGWHETLRIPRQGLVDFPNVNFSDPRVKLADMTGDGLQDIVLIHDGSIDYWPALGRGRWGRRISMRHCPRFPLGYDPRRILVGDVDGDGCADVVYVHDTKVTLWINQSGNGFSNPIEIIGTPPVTDMDAVRLADMLGTGVSGVLWSSEPGSRIGDHMLFLDFTGGRKPYLMNQVDNRMGSVTRIEYASSTQFYLADQQHRRTRWKTALPFPVQVVSRVEVIDAVSNGKLTTKYNYHHGYWDGAEREFRGFGCVDQDDSEQFTEYHTLRADAESGRFLAVPQRSFSPPTRTRTWFHLGPVGDEHGEWSEISYDDEYWQTDPPALSVLDTTKAFLLSLPRRVRRDALRTLRGRILRTELYALDGTDRENRPYTVSEHVHGVLPLPVGQPWPVAPESWQLRVFFPMNIAERTTQWERGDEPMTQLKFTGDYDSFGQPRSSVSLAVPRYRDYRTAAPAGEAYLVMHAETVYAQRDEPSVFIVDRVASVTQFEVVNDGSLPALELLSRILDHSVTRKVLGQAIHYYDGRAFEGLGFGKLGDFGALSRSETLVLTKALLQEGYRSGTTLLSPAEEPPVLVVDSTPDWTGYPQDFQDRLPLDRSRPNAQLGLLYHRGGDEFVEGFFAAADRRAYDFQILGDTSLGLVKIRRDALGNDTSIAYDSYSLLPTTVIDAAGLKTSVRYSYRHLQPTQMTDANGNVTGYAYTPLGLLASTALLGKATESDRDTADKPSSQLLYNLDQIPVSVTTIQRQYHAISAVMPASPDATLRKIEFSDGFGRLIQSRAQAEDVVFGDTPFGDVGLPADQTLPGGDAVGKIETDRVVVSGWQVYDNKGHVVEKYEPFFSSGWEFAPPTDSQRGQKAELYYDPRGHTIRTVNPDGSEQTVLFGVPTDIQNPSIYRPTAWESYTYDANDNAGRTHPGTAASYSDHWNTPASVVLDSLGRTVETVARKSRDTSDWYVTRNRYDLQGNLLSITDALGRVAFRYVYDLAKQPLRTESIDAGIRRVVRDAAGNGVEERDSKGAITLRSYDALLRPVRLWASDKSGATITLREALIYGDDSESGLTAAAAMLENLLGKLNTHYDEAGRQTFPHYDHKGNVLEKVRQVIDDQELLAGFVRPPADWNIPAYVVDWTPATGRSLADRAAKLLASREYRVRTTYDAINRVRSTHCPDHTAGSPRKLETEYNRAGHLATVRLNGTTMVERIAYNAKGERLLIAYGNGTMTRHVYDPKTFRLLRLRSEGYTKPGSNTYRPSANVLQDTVYGHDFAGNVLSIGERGPDSGTPAAPNQLDRSFVYDASYRLLSATGRECDVLPAPTPHAWDGTPRCDDVKRTRAYRQAYRYDAVGNLIELRHQAGMGSFSRQFVLVPGNNRLAQITSGSSDHQYVYDACGNATRESAARWLEWGTANQLRSFRVQAGVSEPTIYAQYIYDSCGMRIKKIVRTSGGDINVTVYADGLSEHQYRWRLGVIVEENTTIHVTDSENRIAMTRFGTAFAGDTTPSLQFILHDHLGSSRVTLDDKGKWINREEYTPYGETSFGGYLYKRFRFTGKERDQENGFTYHGARYYAPWQCRWICPDRLGPADGINIYSYVRANPIKMLDKNGMQAIPFQAQSQISQKIEHIATQINNVGQVIDGVGSALAETVVGAAKFALDPGKAMVDIGHQMGNSYQQFGGGGVGALMAGNQINPAFHGMLATMKAGDAWHAGDYHEFGRQSTHAVLAVLALVGIGSAALKSVGRAGAAAETAALESAASRQISSIVRRDVSAVSETPASALVGRRGRGWQIEIQQGTNRPAIIQGRSYTGHALDRMQGRGLTPTVIENTIKTGIPSPGHFPNTIKYADPVNNTTVIIETTSGRVRTVY